MTYLMLLFQLITVFLCSNVIFFRAYGEGSIQLEQLTPLLENSPGLNAALSCYEIESNGSAHRLEQDFLYLSGTRVGPYVFRIRPINQPYWNLELVLHCSSTWLGFSGTPLPQQQRFEAIRVQEELERFEVRMPASIEVLPVPIEPAPVDDFTPQATPDLLAHSIDASIQTITSSDPWFAIAEKNQNTLGFHLHQCRPLPLQEETALCLELAIEITVARTTLLTLWLDHNQRPQLLRSQDVYWNKSGSEYIPRSIEVNRYYFEEGNLHHIRALRAAENIFATAPQTGLPDPETHLLFQENSPFTLENSTDLLFPDATQRRTIEILVNRLTNLGLSSVSEEVSSTEDPLDDLVERLSEWICSENSPLFPYESWDKEDQLLLDSL